MQKHNLTEIDTPLLITYMKHCMKEYTRCKRELILRGKYKTKNKQVSDKDIYDACCKFSTKLEVLKCCYPNHKDFGGELYRRINKICAKYGIILKNNKL